MAKNEVFYVKIKHIDVKYRKLKEIINDSLVSFLKIHTDDNVADIFTK